MSNRRGIALNIPRFNQVPDAGRPVLLAPNDTISNILDASDATSCLDDNSAFTLIRNTGHQLLRTHSLGPLTPPHDIDVSSWSKDVSVLSLTDAEHDAADHKPSKEATGGSGIGIGVLQLPTAQLSSKLTTPSQELPGRPLLDQALRTISEYSV